MAKSDIMAGEVAVTLDGTEYTLAPNLAAFTFLGNKFDNYQIILAHCVNGKLPTIRDVVLAGLSVDDKKKLGLRVDLPERLLPTDKSAQALDRLLMRSGLPSIQAASSDFVFRLFNGGKSIDEVNAENDAKKEAGSATADPTGEG